MKRTKPAPTENGLTPKQHRLLEELLKGSKVTEISRKLKIARSSVYNEMKKPAFQEALDLANWSLSEKNLRHLFEMTSKALTTAEKLLDSKDEKTRLRAVVEVLKASSVQEPPKPPKAPLPKFDVEDEELTTDTIEKIKAQLMVQLLEAKLEERSYWRARRILDHIKSELKSRDPWLPQIRTVRTVQRY